MKNSFSKQLKKAPPGCSDEAQNEVNFDATNAVTDASCERNQEPIIVAPQGAQGSQNPLLPNERSESINTLHAPGSDPGSPKESLFEYLTRMSPPVPIWNPSLLLR